MSLRPNLTSSSLATRLANALKSTGPRSRRDKVRVRLDALKHGKYGVVAARSAQLCGKLFEAGRSSPESVYDAIRGGIDPLTLRIRCRTVRTLSAETKLKSPLISEIKPHRVSTECELRRSQQLGAGCQLSAVSFRRAVVTFQVRFSTFDLRLLTVDCQL